MTRTQDSAPAGGRVLVTGAAGFIGSHLVDALLHGGYRVHGLDRRSPSRDATAGANLADALCHPRFSFTCLDVAADEAADDLSGAVGGCQAVFHLAAIPGVRPSWGERFGEYVTANIVGTARLLQACERAGVPRLVYASSSSVYGPARRPSRESDPTQPISPYGVTKLAAEHLCVAHAQRHDTGLRVCALRYFTVYGPRQRPDMAIGRVLTAALDGVPLELYGDGSQRRELTYVSDVVAATIAAARVPEPPQIVNVGGGASLTMTEVLALAEKLTGQPVPVVRAAAQPGDVSTTEADLTLAYAALSYHPQVDLAHGMTRQIDWLQTARPRHRLLANSAVDPLS
jgi:nucleoside-diphosphate-sugar epimerase